MSEQTGRGGSRAVGGEDVVPYDGEPAPSARAGGPARAAAAAAASGARGSTTPRPLRYDPRPSAAKPAAPRRRARLALARLDPWSVFTLSLLLSLFLGVVLLVAVAALYALLDSLGVLSSIDSFAVDLQIIDDGQTVLGLSRVLFFAAVLAAVDVVLITALATLGAFLYNLCSSLTGGVEVVLSERD